MCFWGFGWFGSGSAFASGQGQGKEKENGFSYKAVGSGVVDIKGVIEAAKAANTEWLIVEQDAPEEGKTPMQCAEESAMYVLKNI